MFFDGHRKIVKKGRFLQKYKNALIIQEYSTTSRYYYRIYINLFTGADEFWQKKKPSM